MIFPLDHIVLCFPARAVLWSHKQGQFEVGMIQEKVHNVDQCRVGGALVGNNADTLAPDQVKALPDENFKPRRYRHCLGCAPSAPSTWAGRALQFGARNRKGWFLWKSVGAYGGAPFPKKSPHRSVSPPSRRLPAGSRRYFSEEPLFLERPVLSPLDTSVFLTSSDEKCRLGLLIESKGLRCRDQSQFRGQFKEGL